MYHCSAQTTEPSRIRIVGRAELEALLEQYPIITRRLLNLVRARQETHAEIQAEGLALAEEANALTRIWSSDRTGLQVAP